MKIHFWGVRGSIPSPITTSGLKYKIEEILNILGNTSLNTNEEKDNFIKSLPFYLKNVYGGNTTCIEIVDSDNNVYIIDAGTGIRMLAHDLLKRKNTNSIYNIFFTHFHWDHIQGFPFFMPAYIDKTRINFYSTHKNFEEILKRQQMEETFPKRIDEMPSKKSYYQLVPGKPVKLGNVTIDCHYLNHPGGGTAYSFTENGKKVIYTGDVEFLEDDLSKDDTLCKFFTNTDIAIFDSQYTLEESFYKFDWGHTSYSMAVNIASNCNVKHLVLTHFDPEYSDKKISEIETWAKEHADQLNVKNMKIQAAYEGLELKL